jgi:hypothetical protein
MVITCGVVADPSARVEEHDSAVYLVCVEPEEDLPNHVFGVRLGLVRENAPQCHLGDAHECDFHLLFCQLAVAVFVEHSE